MESLFKRAMSQQLTLKAAVDRGNINLQQIQANYITIVESVYQNIELTHENYELKRRLRCYEGDFGDDNGLLRQELRAKMELLDLLQQQADFLQGKPVQVGQHEDSSRLQLLTEQIAEI